MLKELAEFIKLREESITIAGAKYIVRELSSAAELAVDGKVEDAYFRVVVRSTFAPDGTPVFEDKDIPVLKAGSKRKLAPLYEAVSRVNGLLVEAEAKNSDAVQA